MAKTLLGGRPDAARSWPYYALAAADDNSKSPPSPKEFLRPRVSHQGKTRPQMPLTAFGRGERLSLSGVRHEAYGFGVICSAMSPLNFLDRLGAALKSRQLELTGPRKKVAETVGSFKKHFEADELLKEILRRRIKVSRATIYRTLDLLVETGLLRKIILPSRSARYEIAEGRTHHAHIVCKRCKKIIEAASPEIDELIGRLCQLHKMVDYEVTLEIVGSCNGEAK